ncbi:aminoimidazole riboside kinase [Nocardiopsis kunsanensis]|uniref:Aminoimidazole riboside kinase n=1 Tax=Nocardiopsis kunsanensis TaxID=141693 RepID=A0A918XBV7_9ACTN|nr:carbohydrate kinase family protein [Nocardiopsis kunsanensis]GHD24907.1 aminoimidazole riboside kinase [Nocardiopsis kunsanensis]
MNEPKYDVLVAGGAGVDTIVRVDELRVPEGDSTGVPPVYDYVAHTGNGVALGCHTLGMSTKFIDFLGDDAQGRMILDAYAETGLDFSRIVSEHGTPRGINLVDTEGRRFSFYDGRHPADLRLPRTFYLPHLECSRHVHMSITGPNRDMYEDIASIGISSSTDLHDWDGENPHHLFYALRSDLVFLSAASIRDRVPQVLHDVIDRGRARVVVATDGARGCHVLVRGESSPRHYPAVSPERPVVDSNGAGDAFVAAFLYSYLGNREISECALSGAVAGAFACGSAGTHAEFADPAVLHEAGERARAAFLGAVSP